MGKYLFKKIIPVLIKIIIIILIPFVVFAQAPNAEFTANVTQGCSPLIVSFSDQSTNSPTKWEWNLGNGDIPADTTKNPKTIYTIPGTYTVTLKVTNASGSDTETKTAFITVFADPEANFTSNITVDCDFTTVLFSDLSTIGSAAITKWNWDFGDAVSSAQQNPSHSYTTTGKFTVTLLVTDANGCFNSETKSNFITVNPTPVADFSGTPLAACNPPLNTSFTTTVTTGTEPLTYIWNFGDGNTSAQKDPSNIYSTGPALFTVTLIVTDPVGCADTTTKTDYVKIEDLNTDFSVNDNEICVGGSVQFNDLTTSSPNNWKWTFGDGGASTSQNPSYSYTVAGIYNVKLVSSNGTGCADSVTKNSFITVNALPVPGFIADKTDTCAVPFNVNFTDQSTAGSGSIIRWIWNYGDGNTETFTTPTNPSHTYISSSSFSVTLTILNSDSCETSFTRSSYINIIPPNADFNLSPARGCTTLIVSFTDNSSASITNWSWNFNDPASGGLNVSALENPTHSFTDTGTYDVTLIAQTVEGCPAQQTRQVEVGIQPTVNFTQKDTVCYGTRVQFTDQSSSFTDQWMWDFGDGGTSSAQNPSYTYQDTGFYDVQLIAGFNGCFDTLKLDSFIMVQPPIANFTRDTLFSCNDSLRVTLSDTSAGANKWFWDFGNGDTASGKTVTYTYYNAGFYTISHMATNTVSACSDTIQYGVILDSLTINFGVSNDTGCRNFTTTFIDSSTTLTSITSRTWYFGNGDSIITTSTIVTYTYTDTGIFDVTLVITDSLGCDTSLTKNNFINVRGHYPKFGIDTNLVCTPMTLQHTDSSIGTAPITYWIWNYGDSSPLDTTLTTDPDTQHTFTVPGNYTITLTTIDTIENCSYVYTMPVATTFPRFSFAATDTTPCQKEVVTYNVTQIAPVAGATYYWELGDGTKDTTNFSSPNTSYFYSTDGLYTLKLTAIDTNGCSDSITKTNYITISEPIAGFYSSTIKGCYPLPVNFMDTSKGKIQLKDWYFGDGAKSLPNTNDDTSTHFYTYPGVYTSNLVITDSLGCVDTANTSIDVEVDGPLGYFFFSDDTGCTDFDVDFISIDTNGVYYTLKFGDGELVQQTTDSVISHTYTIAGNFHPILIMYDSNQCKLTLDTPGDTIYVDQVIPNFLPKDTFICNTGSVNFRDSSTSSYPFKNWDWKFGDGWTDNVQNPTHAYTDTAKNNVVLTVTNAFDCVYKDSHYVTIYRPPTVIFSLSDSAICVPDTVLFSDNSIPISQIIGWKWSFGNGDSSGIQNPFSGYETSGIYDVSLMMYYGDSVCTASQTYLDILRAYDFPQAEFDIDSVIKGREKLTVNFINESIVNNIIGSNDHNYFWNFGDVISKENTSTIESTTHIYSKRGKFSIMLVVSNEACADTLFRDLDVRNTEEFFTPNVFTPQPNTPGLNDNFFIKGLLPNTKIIIFNRWGQKIYEHSDYQNNWDGADNPDDVYYYVLIHEEEEMKGFVRIVR